MTDESGAQGLTANHWREGGTGQAWADNDALMDRLNQPIADAIEAAVRPRAGERMIDVGCGSGATTRAMARRLGPEGRCVGIDITPALLELARAKAVSEGVAGAEFIEGDAETYPFEAGAYDAVISRFGVMFFASPEAAFRNLRRALKPDGRLVFACWRSAADNFFSQIPVEAARSVLPEIPQPPKDAPGRFAFADPDRVQGILQASGWREIGIAPLDAPTPPAVEEFMALSLQLGALGPVLRQQSEAVRTQVREALAARIAPYVKDGFIQMVAACWLVTATG
jgi:SAM-dependent methyltransferase